MKNGISVVIPAYREEENLRFLLPEIHTVLKQTPRPYEILVIDTCLPMDHTEELCAAQNALCIRCKDSDSYGNAIRTGIEHAQYDKTFVGLYGISGGNRPAEAYWQKRAVTIL